MKLLSALAPVLLLVSLATTSNAQAVISGTGCAGLAMNTSGAPQLGASFSFGVTGGPASANAGLFVGLPSGAPLDLAPIGAPSCFLYLFQPVSFPTILTPAGDSTTALVVPNIPATVGAILGVQYAVIVGTGVNALGVGMSDTVTITIQP